MPNSQFSNKVRVRACAVIVQDSSILLTKINSPTRPEPIWMPPGGGVELGESLEEALYREILEETELEIKKKQLLWIYEFIEEPYHAIEFYFRCEVIGGNLKKGSDPELKTDQQMLLDLAFIPFSEAQNLPIAPSFIKEFCKNGGEFFTDIRHIINSPFEGGAGG
ncbi:NUDIX domain-containing protein [Rhodohalobacter sulfatireducens]|uniref:NUDIX domain-containing protein n=1 Tax=Rhodohalobacter sulfatireducens TaxID=2911366 RepID=UPI0021066899|nr:NUDIX domain-containing protein [Rhodohalobacter sulfatireducens]